MYIRSGRRRRMEHVLCWEKREIRTWSWWGNPKQEDSLEDLEVERDNMKVHLKETGLDGVNWITWLGMEISAEILWMYKGTFGFHITWELLLVFQVKLSSMKLLDKISCLNSSLAYVLHQKVFAQNLLKGQKYFRNRDLVPLHI
jgi:hypothetical protein